MTTLNSPRQRINRAAEYIEPDPVVRPVETTKSQSPSLVMLVLVGTVGILAYAGFLLNPASHNARAALLLDPEPVGRGSMRVVDRRRMFLDGERVSVEVFITTYGSTRASITR